MSVIINGTTGITTPSPVVVQGSTSGTITLAAPAVAGTNTATFPAGTGTIAVQGVSTNIVSGTALAYNWNGLTTNTVLDFTGIPSWVKRITVMLNGISLSGTSNLLVQIGSGSVTNSGYASTYSAGSASTISSGSSTAGFVMVVGLATATVSGVMTLQKLGSNIWVSGHTIKSNTTNTSFGGGDVTLSGTLDRVRLTTGNGTDQFDAGSVNILYE